MNKRQGISIREIFRFWFKTACIAARGNVAQANDWQWVVANPIWQSVGGFAVGALIGYMAPDTVRTVLLGYMAPDTAYSVFLSGFAGFIITWLLAFFVRLMTTPAKRYIELERDLNDLKDRLATRLSLRFTPAEAGTECVHHPVPASTHARVVAYNNSEAIPLDGCEARLESVSYRKSDGQPFEGLLHFSPVNLAWSGLAWVSPEKKLGAIRLQPRVRQPIDVIQAIEHEGRPYLLIYTAEWGPDWLSAHGTYRLRIIVFGEGSRKAEIFLHVE